MEAVMKTKCFLLLLGSLVACGSAAEQSASSSSGTPATPDAAPADTADGGDGATNEPSDGGVDAPSDAPTAPVPIVYAVTQFANLVAFDPVTNTLAAPIVFKGASSCRNEQTIDIAVDAKRTAIVTSLLGSNVLDLKTGECQPFGASYNADALAFLPAGVVAPTETLVGYFAPTKDYRMFSADGATKTTIASPPAFGEADDIVTISDGRTFVTYQGDLTQIDPMTGAVIKRLGSLQMGLVKGLASWGTRIYGFTFEGKVFSVEVGGGTALPAPKLVAQSTHQFTGAASVVPSAP